MKNCQETAKNEQKEGNEIEALKFFRKIEHSSDSEESGSDSARSSDNSFLDNGVNTNDLSFYRLVSCYFLTPNNLLHICVLTIV